MNRDPETGLPLTYGDCRYDTHDMPQPRFWPALLGCAAIGFALGLVLQLVVWPS